MEWNEPPTNDSAIVSSCQEEVLFTEPVDQIDALNETDVALDTQTEAMDMEEAAEESVANDSTVRVQTHRCSVDVEDILKWHTLDDDQTVTSVVNALDRMGLQDLLKDKLRVSSAN